jgi:2-isopropylmalate synthase
MLMHQGTYEIMRPEEVGLAKTNLVLGKHSGRHALRERIKDLGYRLDEDQLNRVFEEFKILADKKKEIYDADIAVLIEGQIQDDPGLWQLLSLHTSAGTGTLPTAAVCMQHADGRKIQDAACGDGPIDAVFKTIERVAGINVRLRDYQVRSVTKGEDAQGEASVEVEHNGRLHRGRAVSTDIIEASARAFLQVINRIAARREQAKVEQATAPRGVAVAQV